MAVFTVISPIRPEERVACPSCGAEPPWRCMTKNGRNTAPHRARRQAWVESVT